MISKGIYIDIFFREWSNWSEMGRDLKLIEEIQTGIFLKIVTENVMLCTMYLICYTAIHKLYIIFKEFNYL